MNASNNLMNVGDSVAILDIYGNVDIVAGWEAGIRLENGRFIWVRRADYTAVGPGQYRAALRAR